MTEIKQADTSDDIVIYLKESLDAKEFDPKNNESIHPQEYQKVCGLINAQLHIAKKAEDATEQGKYHRHEAITVLGTRGSGKTSFLLSIKENFKNDPDLQVLKIIDPTLIEDKGHVFLTIISSVVTSVEDLLKKEEISSPRPDINKRREWREHMRNLAAGLPELDGIGKNGLDGWQDAEFIMDTGLTAVKAARDMAFNFDVFLKASLQILGKKAFLIFFDDIDVHADKGMDVLETLRRYLVTKRMITVISGDLELYIAIIRNKKWGNFGVDILKYEGKVLEKMPYFYNKVTQLTDQYLLKVMQPNRRVHLRTLLAKRNIRSIKIALQKGGEAIDITDYYHQMFNKVGVRNTTQLEVYTTFMLGLPLRSQIQFLLLITDMNSGGNGKDYDSISDVFIAELTEQEVDITLASQIPKYFSAITLSLLLKRKQLLELYQLQPTTTNESLNGTIMSLWLLFNWQTRERKNSFLIFDYFIKLAYVRNLSMFIPHRITAPGYESLRVPNIEGLCTAGDLFNDGVLRDATSAIQSYVLGTLELNEVPPPVSPFFTQLYALNSTTKGTEKDVMDVVFAKVSKADNILAFMPCYSSAYVNKNASRVMYSVYVLIGAIGELVKRYELVDSSVESIRESLKILSQFRSYNIPDFRDSSNVVPSIAKDRLGLGRIDLVDPMASDKDTSDHALAVAIDNWMKAKPEITISTHLLGKMMTRFFYAMNNIASSGNQNFTLGLLFHLQITAFMNAVLVEDVMENATITSFNINNIRLSDTVFLDNIIKLNKLGNTVIADLKLSRWLIGCPLLHAYLRWGPVNTKRNEFRVALESFLGDMLMPKSELSISVKLDEVAIQTRRVAGKKPIPRTAIKARKLGRKIIK